PTYHMRPDMSDGEGRPAIHLSWQDYPIMSLRGEVALLPRCDHELDCDHKLDRKDFGSIALHGGAGRICRGSAHPQSSRTTAARPIGKATATGRRSRLLGPGGRRAA